MRLPLTGGCSSVPVTVLSCCYTMNSASSTTEQDQQQDDSGSTHAWPGGLVVTILEQTSTMYNHGPQCTRTLVQVDLCKAQPYMAFVHSG